MSKTQTTREMLTSHIKRLKQRRDNKVSVMVSRAEWLATDIQTGIRRLNAGGKRPVNGLGLFQGSASSFDAMCAVLCEMDQEIEELEAVIKLSE